MLCDKCGQREANVRVLQSVNGVRHERNICADCAGLHNGAFAEMGMFSELGGVFGPEADNLLQRFREMSVIGARRAGQTAFPERGETAFEEMGLKLPDFGPEPEPRDAARAGESAERLKAELNDALAREAYEKAAELRDKIYLLEKEEKAE